MNALKYFLAVVVTFATTLSVKAADNGINVVFDHMPPANVIIVYEKICGQPVAIANEVNVINDGGSLQIVNQKKDAALKIIEEALAKQAGIEIVHEKDGSLSARKMKSG